MIIYTTNGFPVLIDDEDEEVVRRRTWTVDKNKNYVLARGYKQKTVGIHRWILQCRGIDIDGLLVDHINGDRLDNRFANLRVATNSQNQQNIGKPPRGKSGVRGVYWNSRIEKWSAQIMVDRKTKHLGHFDRLEDAAAAREEAEKRYHPFSPLNRDPQRKLLREAQISRLGSRP